MEGIAQQLKAREPLAEIFHAMSDKPVYVTNYLRCNSTEGIDWHTLGEQLLMAVELGATLVDIPADMFDSSDMELSTKEAAIEEQRQLIARIRSMGGQRSSPQGTASMLRSIASAAISWASACTISPTVPVGS